MYSHSEDLIGYYEVHISTALTRKALKCIVYEPREQMGNFN